MKSPGFGTVILAVGVLAVGLSLVESVDVHMAYLFAYVLLTALAFRYSGAIVNAAQQLEKTLIGGI